MSDDAKRFRGFALDCRALAKNGLSEDGRARLEEIADEMDAEADKIESGPPQMRN